VSACRRTGLPRRTIGLGGAPVAATSFASCSSSPAFDCAFELLLEIMQLANCLLHVRMRPLIERRIANGAAQRADTVSELLRCRSEGESSSREAYKDSFAARFRTSAAASSLSSAVRRVGDGGARCRCSQSL